MKISTANMEIIMEVHQKLETGLQYGPAAHF